MLGRYGITVVGYSPAVQDDGHYLPDAGLSLPRATPGDAQRAYGSDEWLQDYEDGLCR
jgi:hypothetical protein